MTWVRFLRWTVILGLLGALAAGAVSTAVYAIGRGRIVAAVAARPAEAIIVLGALVFPGGGVSAMLGDRLETAYELYRAGKAPRLLLSGDHGQAGYDEVNTMRAYLERKGVPPADIFLDHAGFDTYDSMYRARDVFQVRSAIIVTQRFHLPRALFMAGALGLHAQGVVADRQPYRDARYYDLREFAARIKGFASVALHRSPVFLGPAIPVSGDGRVTHDRRS